MAVSDVNMSSEGSSTSRVRQFGLYKTIDSHTAEFLKLSRKRQIRRGCSCAAVSTAITVTVVVSALLVYEYGFRTDFKVVPNTLRQLNWFQTVNDSKATFDKKAPISNKSTGKLLAIILKALDQKRYLETLVEDHSSQRPTHERTTDYPFQKNVFADRNRRPSKMYEGYKPSSQELFKTRRRESFMKARKIMDYQRVMTYLNTMSLSKRSGETIHTDVSSTAKPLFPGNYRNGLIQDYKYQTAKANTRKESYKVYCTCPPRSNLTDVLEKLYISIQKLRPKAIERIPKSAKNRDRHKPKNNNTVKVQQSKYYSDQRASISGKNIQQTTGRIPPNLNTGIFRQYPVAAMKNDHINGAKNSRSKQNETTTDPNEYNTITYKNLNSSYTRETMPWKLDFGITDYDDANSVYLNNNIKHVNNSTIGKMTESEIMAKYSPPDEQYDFEDKIYNTPSESSQYSNAIFAYKGKTPESKRKTTEEYGNLSNYIDGKKLFKTFVNKTQSSVEFPTAKPLDTKLFSYEIIDPIKIESVDTVKPVEGKKKQNVSQLVTNCNDTSVERNKNITGLLKKQKDKKQPAKPLQFATKIPLAPMIQSYLLSQKDIGILNLHAENASRGIELQSTESDDLPFNVKFFPDAEDEQVTILNNIHTAKVTTNTTQGYDQNKDKSQAKNTQERSGISKGRKKEKILSLTQVWEPMYVSRKQLKSSTEALNYKRKKPKIKEIFYMTGGETPVEDFDDNLSALMYYDKSPVNYTALANSYLNQIERDSIEVSKSMLPESRPSPLEIRRTHEIVDLYKTHLYTSDEQK